MKDRIGLFCSNL